MTQIYFIEVYIVKLPHCVQYVKKLKDFQSVKESFFTCVFLMSQSISESVMYYCNFLKSKNILGNTVFPAEHLTINSISDAKSHSTYKFRPPPKKK